MKNIEDALNKVISTAEYMGQLAANGLDIDEQNAVICTEIEELLMEVGSATPAVVEALRMAIKFAYDAGAVMNVEGKESEANYAVEFGALAKMAFLAVAAC